MSQALAAQDYTDRLPPQDLHAEQATLGSMLLEPGAATRVLAQLDAEDFYREAHQSIFGAIQEVHGRQEPVDIVTVTSELRRLEQLDQVGGPAYLAALIDETPTAAHAVRYAKIVAEKSTLRKLIAAASEIIGLAHESPADVDEAVDKAERLIFALAQRRISREFVQVGTVLKEFFDILEQRGTVTGITGVPSGLAPLDEVTAGFQRSDLIIVAGRPSMGKTSLVVNNIAAHASVEAGVPVGIFSLEMSRQQIAEMLLCGHARVDAWRMRKGMLRDRDWELIGNALHRLPQANIYIDDTPGISVLEMRAKARRLKSEFNIGMLIVDYLQLAAGERASESRYQEISEIARSLKAMARELAVPVLACSQLSRAVERREDKRPILSDLAESGNIEAEADLVVFLFRPSYYERKRRTDRQEGAAQVAGPSAAAEEAGPPAPTADPAELIIAKHRAGPVRTVPAAFVEDYRRFEPAAREYTGYEPEPE
ncbi:MAG: replicative DNA helicase [Armatimonadota bacterium]